jgi:hypothetical protein
LLFGSSGVFEELIDIEGEIVDLAHGQTSVLATRASLLVPKCRGPGPPAVTLWVL